MDNDGEKERRGTLFLVVWCVCKTSSSFLKKMKTQRTMYSRAYLLWAAPCIFSHWSLCHEKSKNNNNLKKKFKQFVSNVIFSSNLKLLWVIRLYQPKDSPPTTRSQPGVWCFNSGERNFPNAMAFGPELIVSLSALSWHEMHLWLHWLHYFFFLLLPWTIYAIGVCVCLHVCVWGQY